MKTTITMHYHNNEIELQAHYAGSMIWNDYFKVKVLDVETLSTFIESIMIEVEDLDSTEWSALNYFNDDQMTAMVQDLNSIKDNDQLHELLESRDPQEVIEVMRNHFKDNDKALANLEHDINEMQFAPIEYINLDNVSLINAIKSCGPDKGEVVEDPSTIDIYQQAQQEYEELQEEINNGTFLELRKEQGHNFEEDCFDLNYKSINVTYYYQGPPYFVGENDINGAYLSDLYEIYEDGIHVDTVQYIEHNNDTRYKINDLINHMTEMDFELEDIIVRLAVALEDQRFTLDTEDGDTIHLVRN